MPTSGYVRKDPQLIKNSDGTYSRSTNPLPPPTPPVTPPPSPPTSVLLEDTFSTPYHFLMVKHLLTENGR